MLLVEDLFEEVQVIQGYARVGVYAAQDAPELNGHSGRTYPDQERLNRVILEDHGLNAMTHVQNSDDLHRPLLNQPMRASRCARL